MKNTMNLYKKYKKDSVKRRSLGKNGIYIIISFVLLLFVAAVGVRFTIEKMLIQSDIDKLNAYLENSQNLEAYEVSNAISEDSKKLKELQSSLNEIDAVFTEKDEVSSYILTEIGTAKPSNVTIDKMHISGAIVSLEYSSDTESDSSKFVSQLKESSIIKEIEYSGYEKKDDDKGRPYEGKLTLVLKGNF
ncbi:MAG: hypothetical protein GX038_00355 [Erysipelothrix sp.]|nr:hypothetical protein [Erysipelothrix sp.]